MTTGTDYPTISLELLRRLDEGFPEKCPDMQWPDRKVWVECGKRTMVRHLISVYNIQNPDQKYKEIV